MITTLSSHTAEMASSTLQAVQDQHGTGLSLSSLAKLLMGNQIPRITHWQNRVLLCVHQQFRESEDCAGEKPCSSRMVVMCKSTVSFTLIL